MDMQRWRDFRARYPKLAEQMLLLGSNIYELGAEKARGSPTAKELTHLLESAPEGACKELGIKTPVSEEALLTAVFEMGSSLLLEYVETGRC